jgi:hypothetical protein
MTRPQFAIVCIFSLMFGSCTTSKIVSPGDYVLARIGDQRYTAEPVLTLQVAGDRVSGRGPVNQWSATTLDGKVGPIIATRMAGPPERMRLEQDIFERLAKGDFTAAVTDVSIGLDPDLYPLLASSQTLAGRSNIIGVQDPVLDGLLTAARKAVLDADRKVAYQALQQQLATGRYVLPLLFADEVVVVHDAVEGPSIRQVTDPSDRFWDVLTWRLADDR